MLLSLNFTNLSTEGYAAFILAIIFTIITLAAIIYFARNKDAGKILNVLTAIVFPMVTVFCWVYLLANLSSLGIGVSLGVSFASAIAYVLIALIISFIVNTIVENKQQKQESTSDNESENEVVEEQTFDNESEDVARTTTPLMIEHKTSSETVEEETDNTEVIEDN